MDDWRLYFIEVLESGDCLNNDGPRLLLRQKLVLFQIEVEVVALAVTKHCTKPAKQTPATLLYCVIIINYYRLMLTYTATANHGNRKLYIQVI